jgi:cytochrome P450
MIQSKIRKASEKFSRLTGEALETNRNLESALDLIIARETQMAAKENRAAVYDSTVIQDELFGFLIAGHETTSTTICWTLKFLSKHQDVQHKLRQHFRSRYRRATEQRDNPSMEEIAGTPIPYLDAIMEEAQRVGLTAIGTMRVAVQDTELLGYSIPKGTDVFFFNNGPGCVTPEMPVDAGKRSKSSAENMGKLGSFGAEDIEAFRPARWLAQDESGVEYFNANAGPSHPFGNGPRGCFGKKWALLEMRIILTLVFWNFELGSVSGELSDTGAIDGITHRPRNCYVSLKPVV